MKTFRLGGIHPAESKLTADIEIKDIPTPPEFRIMLSQCIGAPSKAIVKQGDKVSVGDMIAEAGGFVSAPLHSPVNGTVTKLETTRTPQGLWQDCITIKPDEENPYTSEFKSRTQDEVEALSSKEIISIVGDAGIVGLGGATFPTRVKLNVPEGKKAEYILINGAECEPYLTCDDRLMREQPEGILTGALLIRKATDAKKVIIGIEENKPEAIKAMKKAVKEQNAGNIAQVEVLKKKYPQGSEKQLIYALTRRIVPTAALPIETGCIVDNVATAYAVYEAVYKGKPLVERIMTVTGHGIPTIGNYRVKIGTPINFIIDYCGGISEDISDLKIIAGGPMMGRAVSDIDSYSTKGLSGLLFLEGKETIRKEMLPCIRCSKCISVCPMGLEPYLFMQQAMVQQWDMMSSHGVMNCLECGSCSYACPSSRPLLDMIKLGKQELRKRK